MIDRSLPAPLDSIDPRGWITEVIDADFKDTQAEILYARREDLLNKLAFVEVSLMKADHHFISEVRFPEGRL